MKFKTNPKSGAVGFGFLLFVKQPLSYVGDFSYDKGKKITDCQRKNPKCNDLQGQIIYDLYIGNHKQLNHIMY